MKATLVALALAILFFSVAPAVAQYPSKTITIIVPTSSGTTQDAMARVLAPLLAQKLGQSVIVDNRTGASGVIGTAAVTKATPDGHTLLLMANTLTMTPHFFKNLPYDPVADLAPIGMLFKTPMVFAINAAVPAASIAEFVALARSKPGHFNYGTPGNGTPHHLMMELLKQQAKIDMVHVPYKGSSDGITGLLSGNVEAAIFSLLQMQPHAKAGKLRILAVSGLKRSPHAPDVPTFQESKLEELDSDLWIAVWAPGKTPASITTRLNKEFNALMVHPEVTDALRKQGLDALTGTPEQLGELVRTELVRWKRVVVQAGLKAD
jgi:tripartite-type tricarboxylate transporter receptor subunit TctC